tara:strand:+ start:1764 stop:2690 length:927 start_codon:yes stop_codon:yes gene_type:complete
MSESETPEINPKESAPQVDHVEDQLALIQELEHKLRLLRWGMFVGVIAIMSLGILKIKKTTEESIEPAVKIFKDANATMAEVRPRVEDALIVYQDLEPKIMTAYTVLNDLYESHENGVESEFRKDLEVEYENLIKPAAEDLAKKILVDLQAEAMEKFSEISTESDAIMVSAREELHTLTNSIPDMVTKAINNTLVETINTREEKMREMFPKLTKEKQLTVASRFANLSDEQAEKIFLSLFHKHVSELGNIKDSLDKIAVKETSGAQAGGLTGDVQSNLALLSAVLSIVKKEYETEVEPKTPESSGTNE